DAAGNTDASPATYAWTVDTVPPAAGMTDPGAHVSGTVTLTSTSTDVGGTGIASVTFEYRSAGGGAWTPISALPWNTKTGPDAVADGHYDIRATATDWASNAEVATVADVTVDNQAPTVSMAVPADGSYVNAASADPLSVSATALDAGTGVQQVVFS